MLPRSTRECIITQNLGFLLFTVYLYFAFNSIVNCPVGRQTTRIRKDAAQNLNCQATGCPMTRWAWIGAAWKFKKKSCLHSFNWFAPVFQTSQKCYTITRHLVNCRCFMILHDTAFLHSICILQVMNHHVGVSTQIYQGVFWKSPAFTSTSNSMPSTMEHPKIRRLVEKYISFAFGGFPAPIIWLQIGWRHLQKIDKQQSHCILDLNPVSQVFPPLWASFPHHRQVTLDPQWLPNLVGQESKNWQHRHCHRKVSRDTWTLKYKLCLLVVMVSFGKPCQASKKYD